MSIERHLNDTRLYALLETAPADPHLASCPHCQARLAELRTFTEEIRSGADGSFAQVFTETRIDASKRRILAAIEAQPAGQLLRFPGAGTPRVPSLRARPRWMVAAAAGLIVGLALGRWTQSDRPVQPLARGIPPHVTAQPAVYAVSVAGDDELLTALESVHSGPVGMLRAIHELTPLSEQHDTTW